MSKQSISDEKTLNKKYGLDKSYHHDLKENGVCRKCSNKVEAGMKKICPVIGSEEFHDTADRMILKDGGWL